MNKTDRKEMLSKIIASILLLALCVVPVSAGSGKIADFTEGGHLDTDFGVNFMAEWWYLNGDATLVASDGEKKDVGFFVVMAHQESPMFGGYSHLLTFSGFYFEDGSSTFDYVDTMVPGDDIGKYIALHTPYLDYRYPDGIKEISGTALTGYDLFYASEGTNAEMDLFFQTNIDRTIDRTDHPLNFTTYEHSYGTLHGSILLEGKKYDVTRAEGYMDHMIPVSNVPWPMDMHGWSWFEVTTKNYQAVAYAIRGLGDGYSDYSYKHLTLLNKHNGKVLAQYSGDEIAITETGWVNENEFNRKRPSMVVFSTPELNVTVSAETVIVFDRANPSTASGFVDFMAFQPEIATVEYSGNIEKGSGFYEYLVSDIGVITG